MPAQPTDEQNSATPNSDGVNTVDVSNQSPQAGVSVPNNSPTPLQNNASVPAQDPMSVTTPVVSNEVPNSSLGEKDTTDEVNIKSTAKLNEEKDINGVLKYQPLSNTTDATGNSDEGKTQQTQQPTVQKQEQQTQTAQDQTLQSSVQSPQQSGVPPTTTPNIDVNSPEPVSQPISTDTTIQAVETPDQVSSTPVQQTPIQAPAKQTPSSTSVQQPKTSVPVEDNKPVEEITPAPPAIRTSLKQSPGKDEVLAQTSQKDTQALVQPAETPVVLPQSQPVTTQPQPKAESKTDDTKSEDEQEEVTQSIDDKGQDTKESVQQTEKPIQEKKEIKDKPEKQNESQNRSSGISTGFGSAGSLSDILYKMGVLEKARAEQVKLAEVQSGKSQEEILKSQNIVDDTLIAKAKAELYNIPFMDLSKIPVSPEALGTLPQQVAVKFNVFPVSIDTANRQINLAMSDPLNLTAIEFIEQKTGLNVKPYAADPNELQTMIAAGYTTSLAKEVSEALKDVSVDRSKVRTLDASKTGLIREEKVAEIVTHILGFAMKARASDVHVEPQEKATRVRYRIDGILQEKLTIPRELHDALVSRIKILSGMKIDEKRVPQDGRFNFKSDAEEVDLRVSTLPTAWGEKIVMRLLKKSGGIPELPELGLRGRALKNLQEAILRPHGIILITGPTGSGKTTTLYSIIQKINTPKVNIMTLEDPIEYKIHGVNQVQANPAAGLTFASGMRSFLRQDPNIILVGEIRDQETADLAVQASLTGHLVFSTLHTNDASGALPRLLDMGAEPYLLASSITAIVGQRVVRKIHNDCKTSFTPDPKIIEDMKEVLGGLWKPETEEIQLYKGQGDQDCNNSGYLGRVGIFEVLPVSEKISRLILERAPSGDIEKQATSEGMITMKQDGYMKVLEGITTLDEVLRVAQE